jgi:hypothetical protein
LPPSRGGVTAIDLGHVKTRFEGDYEASIQIIGDLADTRAPVSPDGTVAITLRRLVFSCAPCSCTMKRKRKLF